MRISLVGGGTDLGDFCNRHTGAVVSFAVNRYVYIMVNRKFDDRIRVSYSVTEIVDRPSQVQHSIVREALLHCEVNKGIEIVSVADIPGKGTGLGSSSSFAVGLLNALNQYMIAHEYDKVYFTDLAREACEIEINRCGKPIGRQDQYAAAYGGIAHMEFKKDKVKRTPIYINPYYVDEFESHLMLFYLGGNRDSNKILQRQGDRIYQGAVVSDMKKMKRLADKMRDLLANRPDMKEIGELLQENWMLKRKLAEGITNDEIDRYYDLAIEAGAYGAKVCGAGGGGFLFVFAPPPAHAEIKKALGLKYVPIKIDPLGTRLACMDSEKPWEDE